MLTAVTFYDVVLWLHITFVVLAFGPTFAYPLFLATAERTDPRSLPVIGKAIVAWDRIGQILLLGILIAGVYLAGRIDQFSEFYVSWGFIAVIVIGAASGAYLTPKTKKMIEIVERDIAGAGDGPVTLSSEFQALNKQVGMVGTIVGIFIILTIYVMTAQPFL